MQMKGYIIGIDGGGTGSKGLTVNQEDQVIRRFRGGATNYNGSDRKLIDRNIEKLLQDASVGLEISDCLAICIGSAGVSNQAAAAYIEEVVRESGFKCPLKIVPDSATALAGALENEEGVVLIAGTGSICLGKKKNGKTIRVGGCGHLIDDEGGAYYIGKQILRAIVRAEDKRDEPTVLKELVYKQLQVKSVSDLISWLYDKNRTKREVAYLAVLLDEAVEKKDRAALEIVEEAARGLVDIAAPAVEFFDCKTKIALCGSVLKFNKNVKGEFVREMQARYPDGFGTKDGIIIMDAIQDADYGAILLAKEMLKKKTKK